MASRIKGITIEIGGDTTKLQTALKGVNTEIRSTQRELKDVEKLLKLDPGNTELLAQKHKLLGKAVSETKEKLEILKTAAEQAEKALEDGTISKNQYDALQREIIETEQELKRLEEQANQSATALQKIAAAGEKWKTVGDNISSAGQKLLPVTGVVTAAGTAAVKTAADFESAMSKVAAVSGATGSDLDALTKKAREMGSRTKFSASDAAEAMNYMAMAGWKTEDMLSGIEGVMNLAAASGEDLAATSD
ncbi:MAG: phage tail tape measure protein, partial [Frisingicoccus sp.]|nr:phage tail tape measure protein [Frisingicoccus sp.]